MTDFLACADWTLPFVFLALAVLAADVAIFALVWDTRRSRRDARGRAER